VPLRETVCGLPVALSAIETAPLRLPETPGVKVTPIAQFAPGARVGPQLFLQADWILGTGERQEYRSQRPLVKENDPMAQRHTQRLPRSPLQVERSMLKMNSLRPQQSGALLAS
jgi:hypothetical protein